MQKINILITSIGKKTWLYKLFLQASIKCSSDIKIYVADSNPLAPAMLGVGEEYTIILPTVESPFYYSELAEAVDKYQINLIIPTIDSELELLAGLEITMGCSKELIRIALDKYFTYTEWRLNNIPTPYTTLIKNILDSYYNKKLFVKPRSGGTSIRARAALGRDLPILSRLEPDLIVQEVVQGQEFSIDMLFLNKQFIHCHPRIRSVVSQGEAVTCQSLNPKKLGESLGLVTAWLEDKGANGILNVQGFIKDDESVVYTEVNPRIASGFMHSYIAGAYYPEYILASLAGEAIPKIIESMPDTITIKTSTCRITPGKLS